MSRLMTDKAICRNWRMTIGSDPEKLKRLHELNPSLTITDIIGILQGEGIAVKQRVHRNRPSYKTTPEQRNRLRMENEARLRVPKEERETLKAWSQRLGMGVGTLSLIVNSTEDDYEVTKRQYTEGVG